jgi:hypothetical protein
MARIKNAKFFYVAAQGATEAVAPVRRRECSLNIREDSTSPLAPWRLMAFFEVL